MDNRTYTFNQSTLTVLFGDILDSRAEVIVSSDDCYLSEGGGISRAIALAGGGVVMDECTKIRKIARVRLGDVVVTSAGKLPQRYVFHCITISDDEKDRFSLFRSMEDYHRYIIGRAMDKCFRLMNALDIESIAFPCIGAGVAGIPIQAVAEVMADRFSFHLGRTSKDYRIELYLYDRFSQMDRLNYLPIFERMAVASAITEQLLQQANASLPEEKIVGGFEDEPDSHAGTMSHQVFISYSRKDHEVAAQICSFLDAHGFSYWIDTDGMLSRGSFKVELANAIESSSAVIFLSSQASNSSQYVAKEIALAVKYDKMIIPVMLDDAPFSKAIVFDLSDIDQLDYRGDYEKKLLDNLAFAIGKK